MIYYSVSCKPPRVGLGESSRGNTNKGNRMESVWEGNLPLRGYLRRPLKTSEILWKTSENLWKPLKTSKNLWKPLKTLRLRDPLRGRIPSQRLSVLLPLIVFPLNSLRRTFATETSVLHALFFLQGSYSRKVVLGVGPFEKRFDRSERAARPKKC